MNILVHIPYINKKSGGVLQYSKCLLNILSQDKDNNYYILLRDNFDDFNEFKNQPNFTFLSKEITDYRSSLFSFSEILLFNLVSGLSKLKIKIPISRPNVLNKIIEEYKIEILHCPYQFLPCVKIPVISTMHDIQEKYFPEYFTSLQITQRAKDNQNIAEHAVKIIVSYQHIKDDIIKYFNKNANDVEVVLLNMQNLWFEKFLYLNYNLIELNDVPQNFILYPAATWKHKNHINLLKAIALIKNKKKIEISLVCTGNKTEFYKELEQLCYDLNIDKQVYFIGVVSEEKLFALYKKCSAIVVPTLYEAGSFPVMESILLNVPCICSNVTSLPETIGDKEYVFDPLDVEDVADKITKITLDETYRLSAINNYRLSSKNIINTHSLEKFLYIYRSVHHQFTSINK